MVEPPILPSLNLPTQALPEPPNIPQPTLSQPTADIPRYIPMVAPPELLMPPVGVPREDEEGVKQDPKPTAPEVKKITIPWTDIEVPVPQEEIVITAATTAAVSVVATLTATSLFNYLVKAFKPVFMQAVKRIQKKLGRDQTGKTEECTSETEGRDG